MKTTTILHMDGRWLSFADDRLQIAFARPQPQGPAVLISDFDGSVSNVTALEGSPTHAVALIERRLRADGLIDNEAKILIHKTRTVGNGYQALYTAVPLDHWQAQFAWAENQADHCMLVPVISLLWRSLKTGQALVLHAGRQLTFMALLRDRMVYASALAFSETHDDLLMSVGALADRVSGELREGDDELAPLDIAWCEALEYVEPGAASPEQTLLDQFASQTGTRVRLSPQATLTDSEGRRCRSGIPPLAARASALIAVNSEGSRAAYVAERSLPVIGIASLVLAVVLATLGGRWALAAHEAGERADELHQQSEQIGEQIQALAPKQAIATDYPRVLGFIENAGGLEASLDARGVLTTVRRAAMGQVSILRLRLETDADGKTPVLRVDGLVHPQAGVPEGSQISLFIERLRGAGYDPVAVDPNTAGSSAQSPAGFFSYQLRTSPRPQEHTS
jgi:hypothetical protein